MLSSKGKQFVRRFPGDELPAGGYGPGCRLSSQGLMEITSHFGMAAGAFCARMAGALSTPMTIGAASAATPSAAKVSFFAAVNSRAMVPARIARRRFYTSPPVTPETQGSGDSI